MINPTDLSGKLAIDVQDMNALRQSAKQNSPDALKAAAKQFEALFMNMVMKSMRDATPQDGPFDTEQSKMYTSMLDQQISQNLAKRGVGLADVLVRQLSANGGVQAPAAPLQNTTGAVSDPGKINSPQAANVKAFEDRLGAHAEEASLTTGIPAKFMLGQAALESGWGKHEIPAADGSASHNLFGIKATGGWKGRVVEVPTTEYQNGAVQTKLQKFRVYDSYADAFRDYAKLLRSNPRYENVLANAKDAVGFAQGLQRAGYATDPNYAAKLTRIIQQSLSA
ncbi:MAG TPA: flagellar assembly peptidoglycan hydrolase FlgJ [Oxalobacteraceae bacterium]|nr:flagellar assembly peptidoglycan hydrolase FlgJ [Oxalobacteraceae bacterium]